MYHPGKVVRVFSPQDPEVFSSNDETHVMLSMWDDNLITVLVDKNLTGQIAVDDIVLVDYRPTTSTLPVPKFLVTKVLKGEHASSIWKIYKERYRALKGRPLPIISSQGTALPPPQSYIG